MDEPNHKPAPAVTLLYNPVTQTVELEFKPEEFRTWDFVLAVLRMGIDQAKSHRQLAQMQNMQRAAQEQAEAQAIRRRLLP